MEPLTFLVAAIAAAVILLTRPVVGLCAFCAALFAYPQYLTIRLGVADFSTGRILVPLLLANLILRHRRWRSFRWNRLDTLMIVAFLCRYLAFAVNVPIAKAIEREGGAFFDTVLPYFAVRLIIRSKADLIGFVKGLLWIAAPLALLGIYQSVTWHNPVGFLIAYDAFGGYRGNIDQSVFIRHGLLRADGTFGNYIGFGMYFAALAPLSLALLKQRVWSPTAVLACCILMLMGVVATMSSGPLFSVVVAMSMILAFSFRRYWRPFVIFIVISCVFLEFYSNRHFYAVPTRLAFNSQTAEYRIGLYDEALFNGGMAGHWLYGYGDVGIHPSCDNSNFFWYHKDFTSVYIGILARCGLLALVPFLALNYLYYKRLYQASFLVRVPKDEWMLWCFSAALTGWSVGTLTVGLVAQTLTMFYMLVGTAGNMPLVFKRPPAAQVPVVRSPARSSLARVPARPGEQHG